MEIRIRFVGNRKIDAEIGGFTVHTDQPREGGGDGSAPGPFDLFLVSIGACAGVFAESFCVRRGIPVDGLELIEAVEWDSSSHRVSRIRLVIRTPKGFPEKYKGSLMNAVNLCTVKKHLQAPPEILVSCDP